MRSRTSLGARPALAQVAVDVSFDHAVTFAGEEVACDIILSNTGLSRPQFSSHGRQGSVVIPRHEPVVSVRRGSLSMSEPPGSPKPSRTSSLSHRLPDTPSDANLLMGYAQVLGSFEVDPELVDPKPFEHASTLASSVVGPSANTSNGGGSMGLGLFRGLSLGLESLMGPGSSPSGPGSGPGSSNSTDSSSSVNSSSSSLISKDKPIPLFSTPQTLLFVNLKLGPNEKQTFKYRVRLPERLPPSFRGKALRVHYSVVIGVQRAHAGGATPLPSIVHAPFRVLPWVDMDGGMRTFDLRQPLIQRKQESSVAGAQASDEDLKEDFTAYLANLMKEAKAKAPQTPRLMSRSASLTEFATSKSVVENIDMFVHYSYIDAEVPFKSNFDLGRGDMRIATAMLSRPLFRVGEDITLCLDFRHAAVRCHHVTAALETLEYISPEIAVKGEGGEEATRRVYVQLSNTTYAAELAHFDFTVPATATPQFSTTLISLRWFLKLDFTVETDPNGKLLDQVSSNTDTGDNYMARPSVACETVSCRIPLQIYPTNQDIRALLDAPAVRQWNI